MTRRTPINLRLSPVLILKSKFFHFSFSSDTVKQCSTLFSPNNHPFLTCIDQPMNGFDHSDNLIFHILHILKSRAKYLSNNDINTSIKNHYIKTHFFYRLGFKYIKNSLNWSRKGQILFCSLSEVNGGHPICV